MVSGFWYVTKRISSMVGFCPQNVGLATMRT